MQRFANERSYFLPQPRWFPSQLNRETRAATRELDRRVAELIARRRNEPARDDLLSMMIASAMDDRQLRDEIVTMFLAGHETAASALSWTFFLLSSHAEIAARMNREPELAEKVLHESMRLYPPVYRIGQTCTRDVELGGHAVRAGDEFLIPQWALHRSPHYFPRPESFEPDRWTAEMRAAVVWGVDS